MTGVVLNFIKTTEFVDEMLSVKEVKIILH